MKLPRKISITLMILSLFVLGCVSTACDTNVPSITIEQDDEVAIYSAVIRQIYTYTTFDGTYQPPTLYIVRYTNDAVGDPDTKTMESTLIEEVTQSDISATLQDLSSEIIWVNSFDEVEKDSWRQVINGGAVITIGNIHLQEKNSIQVPGSYFMTPTCGGGRTYILEFIEGTWMITGNTGKIWIS